jgi:hypothetical protein
VPRDWVDWHRAYDDPSSDLSMRLEAVIRFLRVALHAAPPGSIRVLSLCAGEARDLAAATAGHLRATDVTGIAVELDPGLAAEAERNLTTPGPGLAVRVADAGDTSNFRDVLPVDVLLLCGIFGNVTNDDIHDTLSAIPAMCRQDATVIWTRGRREPDITPTMRTWLDAVGCVRLGFDSPVPGGFAVGWDRFAGEPRPGDLPQRLFRFRPGRT